MVALLLDRVHNLDPGLCLRHLHCGGKGHLALPPLLLSLESGLHLTVWSIIWHLSLHRAQEFLDATPSNPTSSFFLAPFHCFYIILKHQYTCRPSSIKKF